MAQPEEEQAPEPMGEEPEPAGEHTPCPTCEGTGTTGELCTFCHATGKVWGAPCWVCKGTRKEPCPTCKGAGYLEPPDSSPEPPPQPDPSDEADPSDPSDPSDPMEEQASPFP